MAAEGISRIIASDTRHQVWLQLSMQTMSYIQPLKKAGKIVVFIPDEPCWILYLLRESARILIRAKRPLPMVILSSSPSSWLWQTLLQQVGEPSSLAAVQAIPSILPWQQLTTLLNDGLAEYPNLQQLSAMEFLKHNQPISGLSNIELSATLALLSGICVKNQAQVLGINKKTLYNHRKSGVKNMVEHHPHLASLFPGFRFKLVQDTF